MPATVTVRSERPADHDAVRRIHDAAFGQPHEGRLVDELRRSAAPHVSLVAEAGGAVVGHVFVSPVRIETEAGDADVAAAALGPVAVAPAHQRQGIGAALIREAIARGRGAGWNVLFLLGNPAYYGRFGFQPAAPRLRYESACYDAAFQLLELAPGALGDARGWVRYDPAFRGM